MKRMLIPALEELDTDLDMDEEFEEIEVPENIDEALMLVMEADEDVVEEFENMDQVDEQVDTVESAVERLENLAEVVQEFGISAAIMRAADPYRELVESGLCVAYEELGNEPVVGDESEALISAIESIIESSEDMTIVAMEAKLDGIIASLESKIDDLANAGASAYGGVAIAKQAKLSKLKEAAKAAKAGISKRVGGVAGKVGGAAKTVGGKVAGVAGKVGGAAKTAGGKVAGVAGRGYTAGAALAAANPVAATAIAVVAVALATIAGVALARSLATHKAALNTVKNKLQGISAFDENKFKGMTKKVLSKDEFGRAIKGADLILKVASSTNLVKVAESIEAALGSGVTVDKIEAIAKKAGDSLKSINTPDIKGIFGLEIVLGESGIETVKSKAGIIKSKGTVGNKGWATKDVATAVDACIRVTAEGEAMVKAVKSSASVISKVASSLKKELKDGGVDKASAKAAISNIKKIVDAYKAVVKGAVTAIYKVNGTATQIAKAAISCAE